LPQVKKFALHYEHHDDCVVVDITKVERSNINRDGNNQSAPAFRFTRKEAEQYLRASGVDDETLAKTLSRLGRTNVAVVTIVEQWKGGPSSAYLL
jgi:hypothetical protein